MYIFLFHNMMTDTQIMDNVNSSLFLHTRVVALSHIIPTWYAYK